MSGLSPRCQRAVQSREGLLLFVSALAAIPTSALAADAPEIERAVALVEQARDYWGIRESLAPCKPGRATIDEIIVCGSQDSAMRLKPLDPLRLQSDPKRFAIGAPPAGGGTGVAVAVSLCFLQKCPKPVHFIDVKSLPEAPPGSEADLIARGEAR